MLEALEDRCLLSTVMNLMDSGAGSLRDAIATTAAGGTVDFAPGLSGTITLQSVLTINKTLTISGPGAGVIAVSGNDAVEVFDITSAAATISGLTITRGKAANGGGVLNNAGAVTLDADILSNNSATTDGGGIADLAGASLDATNCIVSNNTAANVGGGFSNENDSAASFSGCTFSNNTAGNSGGGLENQAGSALILSNGSVNNNNGGGGTGTGGIDNSGDLGLDSVSVTANSGSGIFNQSGGGLTVRNSTVADNQTSGSIVGGLGGGLLNEGTANLTNCTIANHGAVNGGGIENGNAFFQGTLTLINCTVVGGGQRRAEWRRA